MHWQGQRVLVTGAGGFIGSHVVERLVELGARVRALVRYNSRNEWGLLELLPAAIKNQIEVVLGDLTDPPSTAGMVQGCRIIYHLAALIGIPYSYLAPAHYVATNCCGTVNLLEAARNHGVECLVHTSTSETYGTAQYTPIDEIHPLRGQSPYAASKIGADKLAESYYLSFGLPVVTLRPFNTYGPRQSARAIIPTIISQGLSGKVIRLGRLTPIRDLTFVSDTVEGFIQAAACPQAIGQVINLGSGRSITIGELARKIVNLLGGGKEILSEPERVRPDASEVMELICNYSKAQDLLGWEPKVSLAEGLDRTITYIRDHLTLYKPQLYNI
jgi:NAD dependent epimerase/dehydratase